MSHSRAKSAVRSRSKTWGSWYQEAGSVRTGPIISLRRAPGRVVAVDEKEPQEIVLVRHGETEWTLSGRHTGRTDIPLTDRGREQARRIGAALRDRRFVLVLSSPLSRALETCRLAGLGDLAELTDDLLEWDYGEYEGLRTADIRQTRPGWTLWADGVPGGETAADVARRVDRVIERARGAGGSVALFAHGHVLRVLTARWLGLPPEDGRLFAMDPGAVSVLGYEREAPVVRRWNIDVGAT
jgi:probable phosphoglycerate mutase